MPTCYNCEDNNCIHKAMNPSTMDYACMILGLQFKYLQPIARFTVSCLRIDTFEPPVLHTLEVATVPNMYKN